MNFHRIQILFFSLFILTAVTLNGQNGGLKIKAGTTVKMVGSNVHIVLDDNGIAGQGSLTIESGATLDADGLIKLDGALINLGVLNPGNSNVAFSGMFDQTVQGSNDFFNLSLEKGGGALDLQNPFSVTNLLDLVGGSVTAAGVNVLTVETTASITGGSATSFIDGKLEIFTNPASGLQILDFPIGKSGEFRPIYIEVDQTDNTATGYTAEYFSTAQAGSVDASISFPQAGFWTIDNGGVSNFSTPLISLPFNSSNVSVGEKVLVLQNMGATWQSLGGQYYTAGLDSVYNTVNFTQWGDFTVGTTPRPLASSIAVENTNCDPAIYNGEVSADVGGVTSGFDFYWFNGNLPSPDTTLADFKGSTYTGLAGGDYTVVAVNQSDRCESLPLVSSVSDNLSIPLPAVNINQVLTNCDPAMANGELVADVGGSVSGYTFYWFDGNIPSPDTTTANFKGELYTGLLDGDYTLIVLNNTSRCLSSPIFTTIVDATVDPVINIAVTDQVLCNSPDGSVNADVGGVTTGYSFEWYSGTLVDPANFISDIHSVTDLPAGDYTVQVVDDITRCSSVMTVAVPYTPAIPTVSATNSPLSVCEGEDVVLQIGLTGLDPFFLEITDQIGNPFSTTLNAGEDFIISGLTPGNYVFNLDSISDGTGCGERPSGVAWNVTVNPLPQGELSGPDAEICIGQSAILNFNFTLGTGPFDVTLERNSGSLPDIVINGVSTGDNITVTPGETTTYSIKSIDDSGAQCNNSDANSFSSQTLITVNPLPVADAGTDQTVCLGDIVPLDASGSSGTGSLSFSWSSGGVLDNPTSSTPNFNTALIGEGNYEFVVTVTDSKTCVQYDTVEVTVNPIPDGNITIAGNSTICEGEDLTLGFGLTGGGPFTVIYNDGTSDIQLNDISDGHTEVLQPSVSVTYTLVTVTDNAGCPKDIGTTVSATVNPLPVVDIQIDPSPVCAGEVVTITATGATTFTMEVNGSTVSQTSPGVAEFTTARTDDGTFDVMVTGKDNNGCSSLAANASFDVTPLPDVQFEIPNSGRICLNAGTIELLANQPGGEFLINGSPISGSAFEASDYQPGNHQIQYNLTVNGCSNSSTLQSFMIFDAPLPDFTVSESLAVGVPVDFNATVSASEYFWDFGDGNEGGGAGTSHTYKTGGTKNVTLTITTAEGCKDQITKPVIIEKFPVEVMNVITPNGDAVNGTLYIKEIDLYPDNEVKVLNRWGVEIYATSNYDNFSNFWDGTSKGKVVSPGSYICVIRIKSLDLTVKQMVAVIQ